MKNILVNTLAFLLRVFALCVAVCVLVFPAYKGVWAGYAAVAAGGVVACAVCAPGRGWDMLRTSCAAHLARPGHLRFALLLAAIPIVLQTTLLLALRPEPWLDGKFVFQEALAFVRTGSLSPLTYYPPAQTWWYGLFLSGFGPHALAAQLSHIPLAVGVNVAFYALALRCIDRVPARAASLALALYPSFLGYILITPYYHYLYTLLLLLAAWGWVRALRGSGERLFALGAGLASGFAALTKAVQLVAPAQAIVFWFLAARGTGARRLAWNVAAFAIGMAAVVAPWTARNARIFGEPVLVCTSGGLVFYSANNPESNGLYSGVPDEARVDTPRAMLEYSRQCAADARAFIAGHPAAFARLAWLKFLHTWGNESTFAELINARGRTPAWLDAGFSFAFLAGWSALVAAWAAGAWRAWRRRARASVAEILAGVMVLSNAVIYVVFEGGDRHHLPLVPFLLLVTACWWSTPSPGSGEGSTA